MNAYDMLLYYQNKYLVMEKEVRKAQKGIVRLKRREKYLLECIDKYNMASDSMIGYLQSDNEKLRAAEITIENLKVNTNRVYVKSNADKSIGQVIEQINKSIIKIINKELLDIFIKETEVYNHLVQK